MLVARAGIRGALCGLVLVLAVYPFTHNDAAAQETLSASEGWVELPADGASEARAFVVVKNPTMYDAYLVAASTEAAGEVEFRRASDDGSSTAVAEVTVPAYGSVSMAPGGLFIALSDLKRPLEENDTVTLTIRTDSPVRLEVEAVVRSSAP